MSMIYRPALYAKLKEQIRRAALALHAEGRKTTHSELKRLGISGSTARISRAVNELLASGEIPPECRYVRKATQSPMLSPSEVKAMASHTPEVLPAPDEESVWEWAARRYWTPTRRGLYRGART